MSDLRALLLALTAFTAARCAPPPSTAAAPDAASDLETSDELARGTANLTVIGGFGSGRYPIGARVHVFADLDPFEQHVVGWAYGHGSEWHTELEVQAGGTTVWPIVVGHAEAPLRETWLGVTARPKTVRLLLHPDATGVLLLLHGTGGSSELADKPESRQMMVAAYARGLSVVVPEAEESVAGDLDGDGKLRWDVRHDAENVDLWNLQVLLARLVSQGRIPGRAPRYVVGMSNGGAFAVSLGALAADLPVGRRFPELVFGAVVSYCASGSAAAVDQTQTPTAWRMCGQDQNESVGAAGNLQAIEHSLRLARRGVRTDVHVHAPSPLYAERFERVPGIDAATSLALSKELRDGGFLDGDGFLDATPDAIAAEIAAEPAAYPTFAALPGAAANDVLGQLRVLYADHAFYADWNDLTLDFLY